MPNPNHPPKGASIKADPIRSLQVIKNIKTRLQDNPRNLCMFTMGINTAYRASELLSLRIWQVKGAQIGDVLDIKQPKNKKYRPIALNGVTIAAIEHWLAHHPKADNPDAPLYMSNHYARKAITVGRLNNLVKDWCRLEGIRGNFGSHTLRKTWGYHQRTLNNTPVVLISRAFGHATEAQTLEYLGILSAEIEGLYLWMEL